MTAAPRYATPRDPSAPTDGPRIGRLAAVLGKPLLPWQQLVADVATEHNPDGGYRYEIVLITVPRQSGKTTLMGPVQLDRVLHTPRVKTFYTAQTGKDARSRFNDLVQLVQASALAAVAKFRASAGDEGIGFPNGSWLKIFAPVVAALHGETPILVTLDEIWEWLEELGDAILEGAVIPAQMTLAGRRQIWMVSTAGTALSGFMRKWVARGRAGWPRMAYFEWSLAEGDDPYDLDALARFHPAVGHLLTAEQLLDLASSVSNATWLRAFCNVWTSAEDPLITAEQWAALEGTMSRPDVRDIAVTYDVDDSGEGRADGAVVASWRNADDEPCVRVLHAAPGTSWMHDFLVRIASDWKPAVLGADDGGATRRITSQLRLTLGDDAVRTLSAKEFSTAGAALLTDARDGALRHDGSPTLARAIAGLVLRRVGDVEVFSRSKSAAPVAAIVAAAVGVWLHDHQEAPVGPAVVGVWTGA